LNLGLPVIELSFHISRESANRVIDELVAPPGKQARDSNSQDVPESEPVNARVGTGDRTRNAELYGPGRRSRP
jgi:hypothetical protein